MRAAERELEFKPAEPRQPNRLTAEQIRAYNRECFVQPFALREFYSKVDILFAQAGDYLTIRLTYLMAMIRRARPKLVIPLHYRTLSYEPRNTFWIESLLARFKDEHVNLTCRHTITLSRDYIPKDTQVLVMDYLH